MLKKITNKFKFLIWEIFLFLQAKHHGNFGDW
jgi:hypothetical protein